MSEVAHRVIRYYSQQADLSEMFQLLIYLKDNSIKLQLSSYSLLFKFFIAKHPDDHQHVIKTLDAMIYNGVKPTRDTFNTIFYLLRNRLDKRLTDKNLSLVKYLYDKMVFLGL